MNQNLSLAVRIHQTGFLLAIKLRISKVICHIQEDRNSKIIEKKFGELEKHQ